MFGIALMFLMKLKHFTDYQVKEELTNKNNIQSKLDKCQDLEVLYAIKHFEFMEILKPITYFLDTLSKNMVLYIFILQLYTRASEIGSIEFKEDVSEIGSIEKAKSIIKDITTFINSQQNIIGKITSKPEDTGEAPKKISELLKQKLEAKAAAAKPTSVEAEAEAETQQKQ